MVRRKWFTLGAALAMVAAASTSRAEEPIASDVDVSAVPDYIGTWIIELDLMGREMELFLTIADVDGKVGATLDSERSPEPLAIAEIAKSEETGGLDMASELKFGNFAINVTIDARLESGQLVGTIKESSAELFKSDFTGVKHTGEDDLVQGKRPTPTEARFRLPDGKLVRVTFENIETDHADYKALEALEAGKVYTYTSARATKMYTDTDVKFGETVIKKENVAPDYPGVYSLWMRKGADGWSLIFNEEADTWGTRYNPESDVAEVPLQMHDADEEHKEFIVTIDKEDDDSGILKIAWGKHEWTTPFTTVQ